MANVGTGAAGKTLIGAGNGASPTYASIGTNSGLTAHGFVIAENNGAFVATAAPSNGQIAIGSNAADPVIANLTAGTGISISNGPGSITVSGTGSVVGAWINEAVSFNAAVSNGYFTTAALTATLPPTPNQGDTIKFAVDAAASTLTIQANTGQVIRIGSAVSASAGTAASNARGDSVTLVFRGTDNAWIATSVIGTWTVT